jgi:hypothetical protein
LPPSIFRRSPWILLVFFVVTVTGRLPAETREKFLDLNITGWGGASFTPLIETDRKAVQGVFGAEIDVQIPWIGFESEGYYGSTFSDPSTGNQASSYGTYSDVYFHVPIPAGSVQFTPKLGLGYAYLGEVGIENGEADSETVQGAFGIVGVEVNQRDTLFVDFDYSMAFSSVSDSLAGNADFSTNGFYRVRGTLRYRVAPHWLLGVRVIEDGVRVTDPAQALPGWSNRMECLGLLQFQL